MHSTRWIPRIAFVVLALFALPACATDPSLEGDDIVHGHADRNRDPAVMALRVGDDALCSASLIAPRAILTARHCVSQIADESVDCEQPGRQIEGNHPASSLTLLVGDNIATAQPVAVGSRLLVPSSTRLCDADIAVVVLDRDVEGITPLRVDLTHAPHVGQDITAIGFGRRTDRGAAGLRERRDHVPVVAVSSHELEVGQAICSGDSGGPALDSTTGMIIGVVSRGSVPCSSPDATNLYSRVTPWAALIEQGLRLGGG